MQAHSSLLIAHRRKGITSFVLSAISYQLSALRPAGTKHGKSADGVEGDMNRPLRIVIAGGGTGGHLFPGIAIAQEFKRRNSAAKIIFVSTGNPMEKSVLSKTEFELHCITAAGIKGRGIWNQLISVLKIPQGIWESMRILKNFSPELAIGLGSYSAGPVIIGAWLRRIPIAVHEQNLLPGITNRILARFAQRIYISFENTKSSLNPRKVRWTGNPIRRELLEYDDSQTGDAANLEISRQFKILIIGGSQGAHRVNMALIEALEYLNDTDRLHFVHQTGKTDEQAVRAAYRRHDIQSTVRSFFVDMAAQYHRADLLICRAGATTVAEISALGKAVIFIPFPYAADNHQVLNAGMLSNEGAAEMIIEKDLNGKIISEKIEYYAAHPAALNDMARKARRFGNPQAAKNIVDDCYELVDRLKKCI